MRLVRAALQSRRVLILIGLLVAWLGWQAWLAMAAPAKIAAGFPDRARVNALITLPFAPELDARLPVGSVIPGVLLAGEFSGDRADVRCAGRWAAGRWSLEVVRRLDTGSAYDVAIESGVFMRVAAFDHSQIRHTRHVRPVRLEVE